MAKIRRKCSKCKRVGHNKATCKNKKKTLSKAKKTKKKAPKKAPKKKAKKKAKKKTKRRSTTSRGRGHALKGSGSGWKVLHYYGVTPSGNISDKTWAVKASGTSVTTRHGKRNGQKRETTKRFTTRAKALAFKAGEIVKKLNKGYE
jgi:predicted DNA-binding WGR domain protein